MQASGGHTAAGPAGEGAVVGVHGGWVGVSGGGGPDGGGAAAVGGNRDRHGAQVQGSGRDGRGRSARVDVGEEHG
ncbi:TPA: hypothetical protein JFU91_002436 [Enterococcus faecium]|nr:hypothetical protein [Enterococcus faecium]